MHLFANHHSPARYRICNWAIHLAANSPAAPDLTNSEMRQWSSIGQIDLPRRTNRTKAQYALATSVFMEPTSGSGCQWQPSGKVGIRIATSRPKPLGYRWLAFSQSYEVLGRELPAPGDRMPEQYLPNKLSRKCASPLAPNSSQLSGQNCT